MFGMSATRSGQSTTKVLSAWLVLELSIRERDHASACERDIRTLGVIHIWSVSATRLMSISSYPHMVGVPLCGRGCRVRVLRRVCCNEGIQLDGMGMLWPGNYPSIHMTLMLRVGCCGSRRKILFLLVDSSWGWGGSTRHDPSVEKRRSGTVRNR